MSFGSMALVSSCNLHTTLPTTSTGFFKGECECKDPYRAVGVWDPSQFCHLPPSLPQFSHPHPHPHPGQNKFLVSHLDESFQISHLCFIQTATNDM